MIDMANSFREEKVKSTKCLLKALEENADSKNWKSDSLLAECLTDH